LIILVCMTAVVLIWYLKRKRGRESQPLYQKRNKNKDKND